MGAPRDIFEVLDDSTTIGSVLCGERFTLGKSLEQVSAELCIKKDYLIAIESNDMANTDRPEVMAGMIRSYARYLGYNGQQVVDVYRERHGLAAKAHHSLNATSSGVSASKLKPASAIKVPFSHKPNHSQTRDAFEAVLGGLIGASPVIAIACLLGFGGYVGYGFLNDLQQLDVVATESTPSTTLTSVDTVATVDNIDAPSINYQELYSQQALNVPVIEHRDGPIAQIAVNLRDKVNQGLDANIDVASGGLVEGVEPSEGVLPVVSVGLEAPQFELIPLGEAWVQVSTESGTKEFESLLKPGQAVEIPLEGEIKLLKAGNATQLYVRMNGIIYGPIGSENTHVVKNVPLLPTEIEAVYEQVAPERIEELQEVEGAFLAKLASQ